MTLQFAENRQWKVEEVVAVASGCYNGCWDPGQDALRYDRDPLPTLGPSDSGQEPDSAVACERILDN